MAKKTSPESKELDPRIIAISEKLKQMRIEAGYTSYENFAIDKGLQRMQYWRMEKGSNFTFTSLLKILDAYEINLKEFFSDFN